jgi:hypothetical protein
LDIGKRVNFFVPFLFSALSRTFHINTPLNPFIVHQQMQLYQRALLKWNEFFNQTHFSLSQHTRKKVFFVFVERVATASAEQ